MDLRLRPLREEDEAEALAAQAELAADGFAFLLFHDPSRPWAEYLTSLENTRTGVEVPDGMVPATFLVAEVGGEIVGRTSIRHELNPWLAQVGGHIGYAVRPAHRRRGYAREVLAQSLVIVRALGVSRVIVSCAEDNLGSRSVIEGAGGVLEGIVQERGETARRYVIA